MGLEVAPGSDLRRRSENDSNDNPGPWRKGEGTEPLPNRGLIFCRLANNFSASWAVTCDDM